MECKQSRRFGSFTPQWLEGRVGKTETVWLNECNITKEFTWKIMSQNNNNWNSKKETMEKIAKIEVIILAIKLEGREKNKSISNFKIIGLSKRFIGLFIQQEYTECVQV